MTPGNPFSTRNVRPGALPYLFPAGESVETLVERLRDNGWRGQIVGPHGSGKSTLLASLIPAIEREGRRVVLVALHDGARAMPRGWTSNPSLRPPATLIVDGVEQLGRLRRVLLKRFCRQRRVGLTVTSHLPVGLPILYETSVSLELAERIVARLLEGRPGDVSKQEIAECLARHGNDVREMLFDLYDLYEAR